MYFAIGVGDGGKGEGARAGPRHSAKIFFGQLLCKILAFFWQNREQFGNFVTFLGKYNKFSGILIIIFRARIMKNSGIF